MDQTLEQWRPVAGYEGYYEISDQGRARSVDRILPDGRRFKGKLLKPGYDTYGYEKYGLSKNNKVKTSLGQHLVMAAFVGPCPPGLIILHGSGGRRDNRLSNLSYGTKSDNQGRDRIRDGTFLKGEALSWTKLNTEQVLEIYASEESQYKLASKYGVTQTAIFSIKRGRSWSWLTK